ncbi:MAG: trypsin-like peptidase domain-containing protein [Lentisphaerae bacterium]|nr:trypsin-like peptidase domain-containing protein [Lentisphaerota bacterium]
MKRPASRKIAQALRRYQRGLLRKAHVVGVGVGEKITAGRPTGRLCLKVYVATKVAEQKLAHRDRVPLRVARVETDVEEIGKLRPLAFKRRMRPAPPGVSIGHYKITAGTLGCLVNDRRTGRPLILSNNHVLANSNSARRGDAVIQPGAADGGKLPKDKIGELERWVALRFGARPNAVDAALARPIEAKDVKPEIIGNVAPRRTATARRGLVVQKTGRTTEFTVAKVRDVSATVKIVYGRRTALFANQILTTAMSQGGDSGALVTDQRNRAVGLLFAGSETVTICNPIAAVFKSLNVRL